MTINHEPDQATKILVLIIILIIKSDQVTKILLIIIIILIINLHKPLII